VLEEDPQVEEIVARVAALDIGKGEVVCCVRVPHEGKPGRRLQEIETYSISVGGAGVGSVVGQRQGCQTPAGPA
jgi:hypothetical protein